MALSDRMFQNRDMGNHFREDLNFAKHCRSSFHSLRSRRMTMEFGVLTIPTRTANTRLGWAPIFVRIGALLETNQNNLFRGRIEGQLVVLLVGAADGDVVEQQRGREDGLRHIAKVVGDPQVFARGFDAGAQRALVEVVERRRRAPIRACR